MPRLTRIVSRCFPSAMFAFVAACGGGDGPTNPPPPTNTPASVTFVEGAGQTARINSAVATSPAVVVRNASNGPVPNVSVTFAVTGGGGSITGASVTTDANGIARVGSWTLGATPGPNSLSATVAGVSSPATLAATARLPYWTVMVYLAADNDL